MSTEIGTTEGTRTRGQIRIERYDASLFELLGEVWSRASKRQKLFGARLLEPDHTQTTWNVTCRGYHQLLVDGIDREQSPDAAAAYLAVGDGNNTAPAYQDTALNNEVYRTAITDSNDDETALETTTFLDSTEANGETIREVGLWTAEEGGTLLNHSLVDPEPKSSSVALTVTVRLEFSAA